MYNFNHFQINPTQFQQMIPALSDTLLSQVAQEARMRGISEQQIEEGLKFINNLRTM